LFMAVLQFSTRHPGLVSGSISPPVGSGDWGTMDPETSSG
jgi:hypothetical protein